MSGVELDGEVEPKASARCECAACSPTPARTYTEIHRHDCEVRYVAGMKTKDDRRRYLAGVRDKRGNDARERIIDGLRSMVTE